MLHAGSNSTNVDKNNTCDVNNIAGPDNLFYMNGNLLIAEDTSRHYNNVLWAHNLNTGAGAPGVFMLELQALNCNNRLSLAAWPYGACAGIISVVTASKL